MVTIKQISFLEHQQPTIERMYSLMGEALLFQTNDQGLAAAAEDAFAHYPSVQNGNRPPLVLQLFVKPASSSIPVDQQGPWSTPTYCTQQHLLFISLGMENTLVADLDQGYAFGILSSQLARERDFVRHTFIEAASLAMLGLARQFVAIHAACVSKNGVSVLLQGPSGTGKSTLSYACLKRGFQILSEDVVQVKVTARKLNLWGMPRRVLLLPETADYFPELSNWQTRQLINGEWKLIIDVDHHFPGQALFQAQPNILVQLKRSPEGCVRLEKCTSTDADAVLEFIWSWEKPLDKNLICALRQHLQQPFYNLYLNDNPDEAVDLLENEWSFFTTNNLPTA